MESYFLRGDKEILREIVGGDGKGSLCFNKDCNFILKKCVAASSILLFLLCFVYTSGFGCGFAIGSHCILLKECLL